MGGKPTKNHRTDKAGGRVSTIQPKRNSGQTKRKNYSDVRRMYPISSHLETPNQFDRGQLKKYLDRPPIPRRNNSGRRHNTRVQNGRQNIRGVGVFLGTNTYKRLGVRWKGSPVDQIFPAILAKINLELSRHTVPRTSTITAGKKRRPKQQEVFQENASTVGEHPERERKQPVGLRTSEHLTDNHLAWY